MARVEFINSCKKIILNKNDELTNHFEKISAVQKEYGVDMDQGYETKLVL